LKRCEASPRIGAAPRAAMQRAILILKNEDIIMSKTDLQLKQDVDDE
jgi:hypothetical protein